MVIACPVSPPESARSVWSASGASPAACPQRSTLRSLADPSRGVLQLTHSAKHLDFARRIIEHANQDRQTRRHCNGRIVNTPDVQAGSHPRPSVYPRQPSCITASSLSGKSLYDSLASEHSAPLPAMLSLVTPSAGPLSSCLPSAQAPWRPTPPCPCSSPRPPPAPPPLASTTLAEQTCLLPAHIATEHGALAPVSSDQDPVPKREELRDVRRAPAGEGVKRRASVTHRDQEIDKPTQQLTSRTSPIHPKQSKS